jgi:hypothetical protein
MEIGGIDLILTPIARSAYDPRIILAEVADSWPDSVVEGVNDDSMTPVSDVLEGRAELRDDEFFVYRNASRARNWVRHGATAGNANDMVHFLARTARRGRAIEITMVVGEMTPEMGRLFWAIDSAFADAQRRSRTTGPARRPEIVTELKAIAPDLSPKRVGDLAADVLNSLYPDWTINELACHPHDALQFCEVVRAKLAAPVPDHLIMDVMLRRRPRTALHGK